MINVKRKLALVSTKIHAIVAFSVIGQGQALKHNVTV